MLSRSLVASRARSAPGLLLMLTLAAALSAVGCENDDRKSPSKPAAPVSGPHIAFIPAAATGEVASLVRSALDTAHQSKRELLVYVGATWCEPCQRFHHAVERGELDATLPPMTLLEFDLDRDRDRLQAAGYASKYIPLFAVAGADGRGTGKQMEGSIKGEGAVAEITPRIRSLLSR